MNGKDYTLLPTSGTRFETTRYLGGSLTESRKYTPTPYVQLHGDYHKGNHRARSRQQGQSPRSLRNQRRQMRMVNLTKLTCVEKLVTFTYAEIPSRIQIVKRQLNRVQKWFAYHHPKTCGWWTLEDQWRRSLRLDQPNICWHLHFLLYNLEWVCQQKLRDYWDYTTGSEVKQIVQVEDVKSPQDINNYLSKYLSKGEHSKEFMKGYNGRTWGKTNRAELKKLITPVKTIIAVPSANTSALSDINSACSQVPNNEEFIFVPTKKVVDEIHQKYKQLVIKYISADMKFRGKKYEKRNNYDRYRKENGFCKVTGEIFYKTTYLKLRDHTQYAYMNNATHHKAIQFLLDSYKEPNPDNIHTKINQRAKAYDRNNTNI
tara:strand:- start:313 stop:1431 length:1119 start_codon:yes stop_codon:yes gene_type:complete